MWGFNKYQSKQTWIQIAKSVNARQRAGKDSEVSINGVAVPPSKLKKECRRYRSHSRSDLNIEDGKIPDFLRQIKLTQVRIRRNSIATSGSNQNTRDRLKSNCLRRP